MSDKRAYIFGPFRLEPERRRLSVDGRPVELGARAYDILAVLVARAGAVVAKETLFREVWPDVVVEENTLAVHISLLRKALREASGDRAHVLTIAGRGYSLAGEVRIEPSDGHASATPGVGHRSSVLPVPPTPLIGRERELGVLAARIEEARLLTLTGPGGVGKTRLAIGLGHLVADRFPDGVRLVELAPLGDPGLLADTIASALAIPTAVGQPGLASVTAGLHGSRMLLILDNCEHLQEAVAEAATLILQHCPNTVMLATARAPLGIAAEMTFPVQPLPSPPDGALVGDLANYPAVRLFEARARAIQPDFDPTIRQAQLIARICRDLDGIPLALELAAARVRIFTIEQIADRLDDRLRLLEGGGPGRPARQQTMRATIDWSHNLMREAEQQAFAKLAVFSGSFSLDAATALLGSAQGDEWDVIELLSGLVEKSMLAAEPGGAVSRYRLLEATRDYARARLADRPEEQAALTARHAAWYRDRAVAHYQLWRAEPGAAIAARDLPDLGNYRAALGWALTEGRDPALGAALAGALRALWLNADLEREGAAWLETALAALGEAGHRPEAATTWTTLSRISQDRSRARAVEASAVGLELARALGDEVALVIALSDHAHLIANEGRTALALALIEESLAASRAMGAPLLAANALKYKGDMLALRGFYTEAQAAIEQAILLYSSHGDDSGLVGGLNGRAELCLAMGDPQGAAAATRQALPLIRASGRKSMLAIALLNLASYLTIDGAAQGAREHAVEALATARAGGYEILVAVVLQVLALIQARAGHVRAAARLLGYVDDRFAALGIRRETTEAAIQARLLETLRASLAGDELETLRRDGTLLTPEAASAIAEL
jgi:predicted ATPase/DNA-binding winged helix-turn-helix (wHTH) protein